MNVDFRSIRNDSVLEIISVSGVGLQSLEGVKNAQNLQRIVASNNNLTGPFPQDLLEMQKLTEIVLSGNSIRGLVPAALFELTNLQHLLLEGNQLTETVPTEIGKLSSLKELMLAENYMTGNIPSEVSRLPALERISLRAQRGGNQIDGYLPDFALAGQLWYVLVEIRRRLLRSS